MGPSITVSEALIYDVSHADRSTEEYRDGVDRAVGAIRDGRLIVMPTDTVYGIAADAFSPAAVGALLAAKDRGRDYPVPVLVGSSGVLVGLVVDVPAAAQKLADAFWPGALTIIVRYSPTLAWDLGQTGGSVAVRMPDHPVALDVLGRTGPLAVSSANKHGRPPGRDAAAAREQLGDEVAVYLDAGPATHGVPSTIVDCTSERPVVVREGALTLAELATVVPETRSA